MPVLATTDASADTSNTATAAIQGIDTSAEPVDAAGTPAVAPAPHRWLLFLVKAAVLGACLYLVARYAPVLPSWGVALCWAALSAVAMVGLAYPAVVKKLARQLQYAQGGTLARLNGGRVPCLVLRFVGAAVLTGGLVFAAARWQTAMWVVAACAIPLFMLAYAVLDRRLSKEYAPAFRTAKTIWWAGVATGALLCAVYLVVCALLPSETYANTAEAVAAVVRPFEQSPSALLREGGELAALADGAAAGALTVTTNGSPALYALFRTLLDASAFFGIASLLGFCVLGRAQVRAVFAPLPTGTDPAPDGRTVVGGFVAVAAALPVLLAAGFVVADRAMADVVQTEGYQDARTFVRRQVNHLVYALDDAYYDPAVQELIAQTLASSETLYAQAREELVPLINAAYDARIANVDSYLDWYYSLPADYENLANLVLGTAQEYAAEQFTAHIEAGVDDTVWSAPLASYMQEALELQEELYAGLAAYEVTAVPAWLVTVQDTLTFDDLAAATAASDRLVDASELLGLTVAGGAGGAVAGAAAGKALGTSAEKAAGKAGGEAVEKAAGTVAGEGVEKAAGKASGEAAEKAAGKAATRVLEKASGTSFFKTVVEKIAGKLGSKAVGSVVGGAVGSVVPVVGTIVGAGAGLAISVGVDYALLAFDEYQNRDSYREELVCAIEEERAAVLASIA